MKRTGQARLALIAVVLATANLATGCAAAPQRPAAPPTPAAASVPGHDTTATPRSGGQQSHGRSHGTPAAAAGGLPADWPTDVSIPPGQLQGATGAAGRWTALLVVSGSAAEAMTSTARFYAANGFTAVTDSLLRKGHHLITIGVENRDHSATQTNLVIAVTTTP